MLSITWLTRVRFANYPGWEADWGGDSCVYSGFYQGIWDIYWKHAWALSPGSRRKKRTQLGAGSQLRPLL